MLCLCRFLFYLREFYLGYLSGLKIKILCYGEHACNWLIASALDINTVTGYPHEYSTKTLYRWTIGFSLTVGLPYIHTVAFGCISKSLQSTYLGIIIDYTQSRVKLAISMCLR